LGEHVFGIGAQVRGFGSQAGGMPTTPP
jgi:hypothetical protein